MGKTDNILKVPAKLRILLKGGVTRRSALPFLTALTQDVQLSKGDVVEPVTPRPKDKKNRSKEQ